MMRNITILCVALFVTAGCSSTAFRSGLLFDDFHYTTTEQLEANRWTVRTAAGWPGVPGAVFSKDHVTFRDDPSQAGNRVLRMTSSTRGSTDTRQTQLCHERKYLEGTYAARVRFTDAPAAGPDGDQIVETFYMISPLKAPMDLDYSEMDYEYLPNGGWGHTPPTIHTNTWETFSPEPNWIQDSQSTNRAGPLDGWHTLVLQTADDKVRYFLDGDVIGESGGRFFPEVPMSINFNLWFIKDGLIAGNELRTWIEDVDWVFHRAGEVLSPAEVNAEVTSLRSRGVKFTDTVPARVPALPSPCDL